jgi:heme exporter protein B
MPYLSQLWALAWKDLLVELRSRERVGAMAGFIILVGVLFNYAIDPTAVRPEEIASALTWLTMIFAGTLGLGRTFEIEAQDGAFQGVLMAPAPRDALFLGKVLSNYVIVMIAVVLAMAVFAVLFALDWGGRPGAVALALALGALGFTAVGTLFSAISAGTAMGGTLLPILLFPLLVPVVIYGTSATSRLLAGRPLSEVEGQLRILGAVALVAVAAGAVLFRYVIEE